WLNDRHRCRFQAARWNGTPAMHEDRSTLRAAFAFGPTLELRLAFSSSQMDGTNLSELCRPGGVTTCLVRLTFRSFLERAKGFEPSTPTLARLCSTPELHPHPADPYHIGGGGLQALAPAALASLGRAAARCAAWHRRR